MEFKITKEKILEAASKCNTAGDTLKILFPEAFEEKEEYFAFGEAYTIDGITGRGPIYIGKGNAPKRLRGKCLILNYNWEVEVKVERDGTCLLFKKKI